MLSAAETAWSGVNSRLSQSAVGRALKIGASESFGWYYEGSMFANRGLQNQGFLGLRGGVSTLGQRWQKAKALQGVQGLKARMGAVGKFAGGTAFKALPLVGTAYFTYQGYKEGGIGGAVAGFGESVLWSAAPRILGAAIGGGMAAATAAVTLPIAATIAGTYAVGKLAKAHYNRQRNLELGGGAMADAVNTAGAATLRQRSLSALQNTHLNGRMAMGNEALLMHTPFR